MPYTQQEIDSAKIQMDNAYASIAPAKLSMDSWCNALSKYKFTEGTNRTTCSQKISPVCGEQFDALCCNSTQYGTQTCENDKSTYNSRVTDWERATDNYENAKDYYETIKGDKKQGEVDENISQLEQDAKAIRTGYYVFGAIVIVVIIAGIFIWIKYKNK